MTGIGWHHWIIRLLKIIWLLFRFNQLLFVSLFFYCLLFCFVWLIVLFSEEKCNTVSLLNIMFNPKDVLGHGAEGTIVYRQVTKIDLFKFLALFNVIVSKGFSVCVQGSVWQPPSGCKENSPRMLQLCRSRSSVAAGVRRASQCDSILLHRKRQTVSVYRYRALQRHTSRGMTDTTQQPVLSSCHYLLTLKLSHPV